MTRISIIIPTKNGGNDIQDCLSGIFTQETEDSFEVIVIDSGSSDNTLKIIKQFPVKVTEIKPEEFGHGRTRNLGARLAAGQYLVFLNQDAIPANRFWLNNLTRNITNENIAGVYSRWLPKPDCNPLEAQNIPRTFGPIKEIKSLNNISHSDYLANINRFILFSTVSCCISKSIWEQIPFNDKIPIGEDQEWAKKVLEAGYTLVYEPQSIVYHSHNYSLKAYFKRHFDSGLSFREITGTNYGPLLVPATVLTNFYGACVSTHKIKLALYSIVPSVVGSTGLLLGANHRLIPSNLKKKFSTVPQLL
jgi:rhamnosyltransferase